MAPRSSDLFPGKLIVHVGDHKAGSTTIQAALMRKDVQLTSGKLAYPVGKNQFNHNTLSGALTRRGRTNPENGFFKARQLALAKDPDVTLLSAESLEKADPRRLKQALETHFPLPPGQLAVIAYLRPHPGRTLSAVAERIRIGHAPANPWTGALTIARMRFHYARRIARWQASFGEAYIARPFLPEALINGSPLDDLFTTALGPGQVQIRPTPRVNASLPVEDLMRLHVVLRALRRVPAQRRAVIGRHLAGRFAAARAPGEPGTKLELHRSLAEQIHRSFRKDAARLDATITGGRPLFTQALEQAVESALPQRLSLSPRDWLSPGDIRDLEAMARDLADESARPGWMARMRRQQIRHFLES